MINRLTTTLYFVVVLGGMMTTSAQADDVWSYARERSQRQPAPATPAAVPEKPAKKEAPAVNRNASRSAGKLPAKAKTEPQKTAPVKPEKSVPALQPKPRELTAMAEAPMKPAPVVMAIQKPVEEEAVNLGKWIKKVVDIIRATPDEADLREDYVRVNHLSKQLSSRLESSNEKLALQQKTLQMLQRKLKELQSPALPLEESRREVFAAGMAAGYGLLDLMEARKEIGIELPKEDFMAGVQEVMNNGQRLPKAEFEDLLSKITNKVSQAEQERQQQREQKDLNWKTAFSREKGTLKNEEGIWYQIRYAGDRVIEGHETMTLSLSRQLTDGTVLEDSDTSGQVLRIKKDHSMPLLKDILNSINLHGDVKIAMPVDMNGTPYPMGPFYEIWNIRISDASNDETDSYRRSPAQPQ